MWGTLSIWLREDCERPVPSLSSLPSCGLPIAQSPSVPRPLSPCLGSPILCSAQLNSSCGSRRRAMSQLPFTERGGHCQAAVALPARGRGDGAGQACGAPGKAPQGTLSPLPPAEGPPALNCPADTHGLSGLLIGEPRALHNTASEPRNWCPELRSLTLLRLCAKARRERTLPTLHPHPPGPQATWGPMM